MRFRLALWALALLPCAVMAKEISTRQAPTYAASSIINLASGRPGPFAPNTLVALYGQELSFSTATRGSASTLPKTLGAPPVQVIINNFFAPLEYVSPELIVFLIPADQGITVARIQVLRNGVVGPVVRIPITEVAPALFELENRQAFARHAIGLDAVNSQNPATPGETLILYAAGLGPQGGWSIPPDEPPAVFTPILYFGQLRVLLNGEPIDNRYVLAAGLAAGRIGCYEIELTLPPDAPEDPEITVAMGESNSQPGLHLPLRWPVIGTEPQPASLPMRSNQ